MSAKRSDGLDNPLSPNSGIGEMWDRVWARCDESPAVQQYDSDEQSILFAGGDEKNPKDWHRFTDPQQALASIRSEEAACVANARLLEAAPYLIAALRPFAALLDNRAVWNALSADDKQRLQADVRAAQLAIAKAEGNSP